MEKQKKEKNTTGRRRIRRKRRTTTTTTSLTSSVSSLPESERGLWGPGVAPPPPPPPPPSAASSSFSFHESRNTVTTFSPLVALARSRECCSSLVRLLTVLLGDTRPDGSRASASASAHTAVRKHENTTVNDWETTGEPEGRLCQEGGGGLGGGPPAGGGGREGGGFLVLATMSGSAVNCLGGLVGPEESESANGGSARSKMSAALRSSSCSPAAPSSGRRPAEPLVTSGGWAPSREPPDGLGGSEGSGKERAPSLAAARSRRSSGRSASRGSTAGAASRAPFSSVGSAWPLASACS
ncbi:hypothetical protein EYF80_061159 [Liparis tanakae]|uniref:Uncharacterized protein n=1 Tax=Liparis tanakae TaxID=230148 RepID=A0A4Z2EK19_9TELE|nr:hypothetical protein EYF80_061159 [Liparis tanakae]